MSEKWRSIAYWPRGDVNLGNPENKSEDSHASKDAADHVCSLLHLRGFGGDGKIFPIRTEVIPPKEKTKIELVKHQGKPFSIVIGSQSMQIIDGKPIRSQSQYIGMLNGLDRKTREPLFMKREQDMLLAWKLQYFDAVIEH